MEELGRLHDAALVRTREPDRTGGAVLPVADEKGRDRWLRREFFRLAFPSRVRDVCGPRGSSEYTQRAVVSGGVRQRRRERLQKLTGRPFCCGVRGHSEMNRTSAVTVENYKDE